MASHIQRLSEKCWSRKMLVQMIIFVLGAFFAIGAEAQNAEGEIVFQENLRWNYTYMNPTCTGPDGGRNPCTDIRICTFAVASLAMGGWPTLCGWVGKGVPKVCCGLPLVLGEGLMKKMAEEQTRKRDCGTRLYPAETEITKRFFLIKSALPEINVEDSNKFDPPLDLEQESLLIPPVVASRSRAIASRQGHFPWMVSIRQNNSHVCGGTLIDRKHILTAASCVNNDNEKYAVHVGNLYVDDGYVFDVSKIDIHPQYDSLKNFKNLAILTLTEKIRSPNVAHICLLGYDSAGARMEGMITTLLQWSTKIENEEKKLYLNILDDLVIAPTEKCLKDYKTCSNDITPEELEGDFICATISDGNTSQFKEDIGGPLMYRNSLGGFDPQTPWTAVALDTFGLHCGDARSTRLLTKISTHMNWIEQIMNE